MLKQGVISLLAGVMLALSTQPGEASSRDSRDAEYDCRREMERRYDAESFHGVTVIHKHHHYEASGYAERGRDDTSWFQCNWEDGRVDRIQFDGWHRDDDHDSDKKKKIAAGIAAAAVIAAIASSKRKHHDDDDDDYRYNNDYRSHDDRNDYWSPSRGVTCYRNTRQCYQSGSGYSAYWTNREFH